MHRPIPDRPTVLFVATGSRLRGFGGAALRYAGRELARRACAEPTRVPVRCPDEEACRHPADPADELPELPFDRRPEFHDAFCAVAADGLRETIERVRPQIVVASGLEMWKYLHLARRLSGAP